MKPVDAKRIRKINNGQIKDGPVLYWMSRNQRVEDNWALIYAQETAHSNNQPLFIVFCLFEKFPDANFRHFSFMIAGLKIAEKKASEFNIPFYILNGNPKDEIVKFSKKINASVLVTDFSPLKIKKFWLKEISDKISIPFYEVDAHNIVPVWIASNKQEYAARTMRPKIRNLLPEFLTEFPKITKQNNSGIKNPGINWGVLENNLKIDRSVISVSWIKSGEEQGLKMIDAFIENKLDKYSGARNNPNIDGLSNFSPYLHFGQISAQRIALEVLKTKADDQSKETFLEELIIRRELSDNFCFYNSSYDSYAAIPKWAKISLEKHQRDKREYVYSLEDLETSKTHDDLWNASQKEMVLTGKMHGYMRMYWAKKILEWSRDVKEAIETAIYLNDKYSLDGRDPNGYTGILWSIGGLHDRPWFERPVFGSVRYMSYNGCKNKFDVKKYIRKYEK